MHAYDSVSTNPTKCQEVAHVILHGHRRRADVSESRQAAGTNRGIARCAIKFPGRTLPGLSIAFLMKIACSSRITVKSCVLSEQPANCSERAYRPQFSFPLSDQTVFQYESFVRVSRRFHSLLSGFESRLSTRDELPCSFNFELCPFTASPC